MSRIENSGAALWALEIFKKPGESGFIMWLGRRDDGVYLTIKTRRKVHPDLTGQTFGRITALAPMPGQRWLCRCSCGKYSFVVADRLRDGHTRSCGCFRRELAMSSRVARNEVRPPQIKYSCKAAARINAENGTTTIIPLAEYAAKHGRPYSTVLFHLKRGYFTSAKKVRSVYLIDGEEQYPAELPQKGSTPRPCRFCGKDFVGSYNNLCCPECRVKRKETAKKMHNNGIEIVRTDARACARCGRLFTIRGGKRRFCPDCARARISEYVAAQKAKIAWARA